jgi:hypothetical protein
MKCIPDLSKITILHFTRDLTIHAAKPSATLARRLLNKMPKINTLRLPYNYLLCLIKSPLIVRILTKQIGSLCIQFYNHLPVPEDMIQIVNVFSTNLHFLYFEIHFDLLIADVYPILPLLFSEKWKKLYTFDFQLLKRQPRLFPEVFKQRLEDYLHAETERRKSNFHTMEYRITDKEFSIAF